MTSFDEYFDAIGASSALRERVLRITRQYGALGTDGFDGVFVSEYVDDSGDRIYESVWLFTDDTAMEARLAGETEDMDQVRLRGNLERWQVSRRDYDFGTPKDSSRLTASVSWVGDVSGTLKATGANCEWLRRLIAERFAPNLHERNDMAKSKVTGARAAKAASKVLRDARTSKSSKSSSGSSLGQHSNKKK